ncbi:MAG: hypothetical protein A2W31_05175 [Planctomycetes bacterium RBG_16_64_10]|nr:MAG: hypothetical protein A2W31_05175 [Planctomycetes bacterium RBG_16_64_10]
MDLDNEQIDSVERGGTIIVEIPLQDVALSGCAVPVDILQAVVTHERWLLLTIRKQKPEVAK